MLWSLGMWTWLAPRYMLLPHVCYCAKFCHSRSNRTSVIMEIWQKTLTSHAPPFKVTQGHWNWTDSDRSATYDFLLVFHSNYGPISYCFWENGDICKKNVPPPVFNAPLRNFAWNVLKTVGLEKTRMMPLPDR